MRKMKDSGFDWIGEIPVTWQIKRIKNIGQARNGLTYTPNDVCDPSEGTLVLRSSNIKDGKISLSDCVYVSCAIPSKLKVKEGDILICSRNGSRELVGKSALIGNIDASYGAFMMVFRCRNPKYMFYVLNSNIFSYYLGSFSTSTINQLTGADFGNMRIAYCPDMTEQKKIADFLDEKCGEIDSIKADVQRQIELLNDYKKSVITEAVTKGLNPKAKLKDSDIEWVGKIPEYWEVKKTKYCFEFGKGLPITKENLEDSGISVISYGQIHSKQNNGTSVNSSLIRFVNESYLRTNPLSLVHKNDFIFADTSEDLDGCGNCVYIDTKEPIFAGYHTIIFRSKQPDAKYFAYLFLTDCWRSQIRKVASGVKLFSITQKILKETSVIIPPLSEQKEIANYLDEKCSEIDAVIADKQKQLETLDEYKKSLIFEYVTGKKEVVQ